MNASPTPGPKSRRFFPSVTSRAGRISLWLSTVVLVCAVLHAAAGNGVWGGFFLAVAFLTGCLLTPFLLFLLLRSFNRRVLWRVRNRLIVTYLLMGLAPVVLFCTLTAIAGYIFAGQYSINSALLAMDEAAGQLKGEVSDFSGAMAMPRAMDGKGRLNFDQMSNPRQTQMSVAVLKPDGLWHTVTLVANRGSTPPSPFDGQQKPSWMQAGFHGVVALHGKLYLCSYGMRTEDKTTIETIGAYELNHTALNSVAAKVGHVLLFPGHSLIWGLTDDKQIDDEDRQAEQTEQAKEDRRDAEQEAREDRQEAQEQARDAQNQAKEDVRDAQQGLEEAQRDLEQGIKEGDLPPAAQAPLKAAVEQAQKELQQATAEAARAGRTVQASIPPTPAPTPAAPPPPPKPSTPPAVPRSHLDIQLSPDKPAKPDPSHPHIKFQMGLPPPSPPAPAPSTSDGFSAVSGGTLPAAAFFFDSRLFFVAPMPVTSWADGHKDSATMVVISRPSLLYTELFSTSVEVGSFARQLMEFIAVSFAFIELLALWMATRLSRTITRSVAGLYRGTTEIDRGNLAYRVRVERRDQLGALANSFNAMAGSIQDLLVQQREKERLLSELAIAQEVQQNLFPHSPVAVSGLEMHAVCIPARSVSGDYFDFIFSNNTVIPGVSACIALGDISGKGISAALLMASLHSAVRAFSLGEERATPSPARLLELLNRHLYSSTQPNKYATLFLAFYNAATRTLTYANGGHLPPFLLRADGSVERLDVGGSVVGLLDDLRYDEASVGLNPGDLLVAFTDGLTEPERKGEEFGEEHLLTVLQDHRTETLPALAENTFAVLRDWIAGEEQPDDMTLLLVRAV